METVSVIGLGYIGLPTAVLLADSGLRVLGVDVNPVVVETIAAGRLPFFEPELAELLSRTVHDGRLTAHLESQRADAHVIAVPTPVTLARRADLTAVRAAVDYLAPLLEGDELIVLESTSPPGTTDLIAEWVRAARPELTGVDVVHCPERVLPGRVVTELVGNDRIIGGTPRAARRAAQLYRRFCIGSLSVTDARTAEMAKLVENAYRDVNIAFANELSLVCADLDIDVFELIRLANHHPRVNILQPGPGVGGHCIAVDPWFLVEAAPHHANLMQTARLVNDAKPWFVGDQIISAVRAEGATIVTMLGLSYKANIDDLRQSPATAIVERVARAFPGTRVLVVEPHVADLPPTLRAFENVELVSLDVGMSKGDVIALLVNHDAFGDLAGRVAGRSVVDPCGILALGIGSPSGLD